MIAGLLGGLRLARRMRLRGRLRVGRRRDVRWRVGRVGWRDVCAANGWARWRWRIVLFWFVRLWRGVVVHERGISSPLLDEVFVDIQELADGEPNARELSVRVQSYKHTLTYKSRTRFPNVLAPVVWEH